MRSNTGPTTISRIHLWTWIVVWALIVTPVAFLGLRRWTPGTVVVLFVLVGFVAGLASLGFQTRDGVESPPSGREVASTVAWHGALGGAAVLLFAGVAVAAGSLVWAAMLLAALTSPWTPVLIRRMRGSTRGGEKDRPARAPSKPSAPAPSPPPGPWPRTHAPATVSCAPEEPTVQLPVGTAAEWSRSVRALDDTELCTAWRSSFRALEAAQQPSVRADLVALRQACIDEMERRYPNGLRAWLESGARAAGNPTRYLGHYRDAS
ncbi:MAG: hypothetical protein ACRDPB_00850 [Nocardioidaceae bacterium]